MSIMRAFLLTLAVSLACGVNSFAQENTTTAEGTEEQKTQQKENQKRAFQVLEQVSSEAQFLKLAENRIRVQITVADFLWDQNQERARSLFSLAGEGVAELVRNSEMIEPQPRRGQNAGRSVAQLRQELVLRAARHDAPLAYQLMAATRPVTNPVSNDVRTFRRFDAEEMLEQSLLAQVAALDPKLAAQNAEQMLDKGEFPRSVTEVLRQLQSKDKEAALKFEDKVLKKLQSANLVSNVEAGTLAAGLLRSGPRIEPNSPGRALLGQSAYQELLGAFVESALKLNVSNATTRRGPNPRARSGAGVVRQPAGQTQTAEAQIEQMNSRRMLSSLATLLPQVDQYVPDRAAAVRQKLTDAGINEGRRGIGASFNPAQTNTSEAMMSAAASAPPQAQSRLYRQAAMRALDEGNTERARQIANDHLQANLRDLVLKALELRQLATKAESNRLDEVRMSLAQLQTDGERIGMLLQLSASIGKQDPEFALQLVEQAREYAMKRATSYETFDHQLRVAAAFTELGSDRGFDLLEPGIVHLNELLSAATVLNGFEVNVFRDGEMPLQGGSALNEMIRRFGQQIGELARLDFERAQNLTNRFQFGEPRVIARLAIVHRLLGRDPMPMPRSAPNIRTFR